MRSKNVPCSQNHLDLVSSVMFFAAGTPCRFLQTHNSFMSGANTQSVSGFIPCNGANCWAKSLLRLKARLSHGHGTQSALHGKFMKKTCKNNVLMYTIVRYCDHTSVNSFVFTCSWFHQANSYGGATLAMVHDPVLSEKAQTLHHFLPVWEFTGNYSSAIQHLYNLIPTEVQTWNRIKHVWFLTFQYTMFTCWEVRSYQFHMEKTQTWNCWTLSWQSICKGLKNAVSECKF